MTVAADRAAVLAALRARRDLADWSVRVVTTQRAWRRLGELAATGTATGATIAVAIHRDASAGRGSASFTVTAGADARPLLALALIVAAFEGTVVTTAMPTIASEAVARKAFAPSPRGLCRNASDAAIS